MKIATNNNGNNQRSIKLPQGEIRYRESGSGEPILFVHGLLVSGSLWRKVTPNLSRHFRCIVPDLPLGAHEVSLNPGTDLSPIGLAKLIADFIIALDLKNVTLVGNDTGGALCQLVITEFPDRISRLVLTNCDCFENFPPKIFRPTLWAAHVPGFIYLLAQSLKLQFMRNLPVAFGALTTKPIEKEVVDRWLAPITNNSAIRGELQRVLTSISSSYTIKAAEKLQRFNRPVLLAWAPKDRFFPYSDAEKLRQQFPDARLEQVQNSLTFVPEDQPEYLARLIDSFISEKRPIAV